MYFDKNNLINEMKHFLPIYYKEFGEILYQRQ